MILLDDAQSTAAKPSSRHYERSLHYWRILSSGDNALDLSNTQTCLAQIEASLARGEFVVAAFAYELGRQIHRLPQRVGSTLSSHPLIEAWSFKAIDKLSKEQVDALIADQLALLETEQRSAGVLDVHESLNEKQFASDIASILEYIRSGDSYQINHTYRLKGKVYGSPLALYSRLRDRQPGRFGAYIAEGNTCLLSQSPELFIAREGDTLKAMPMKGTASALSSAAEDLSADPKNRAENVMIVDLLRNDLSRISLPGSVTISTMQVNAVVNIIVVYVQIT